MRLTIDHNDPLLELKFISYMIHPGDDVKREEFHAVMLAEKTLENDAKVVSDPFSMLVSAGRKEVIRGLNLSIDRGIMAGNVLLYVIQMQYHGIADAGLDKAAYMTSRYLHERDKLGDGVYVAGRDTVNQNWKKYRSVSHYWAAYFIYLMKFGGEGDSVDIECISDLLADSVAEIVATGNWLFELGRRIQLPRTDRTCLRKDDCIIIYVGDVEPLNSSEIIQELTETEMSWLTDYIPRFRDSS